MTRETDRLQTAELEENKAHLFRMVTKDATEGQKLPFRSICFIARHPGPGAYFAPVAEMLSARGVDVYLALSNNAKAKLESSLHASQIEPLTSIPSVDWAMVASDTSVDFEIEQLSLLLVNNPRMRLAVGEEVPGGIMNVLSALLENPATTLIPPLVPDAVFTTTIIQREDYSNRFPLLADRIIAVGQPSFDDTEGLSHDQRTMYRGRIAELAEVPLQENMKILVFAGVPMGDYPEIPIDGVENAYTDLNSHALHSALLQLQEVAKKNPDTSYIFVYKPHPREAEEMKNHPYLQKFRELMEQDGSSNVQLLYANDATWEKLELKRTSKLCHAADIAITTTSTLSQEIAIAAVTGKTEELALPLIIQPKEYFEKYAQMEADGDPAITTALEDLFAGPEFLRTYHAATFLDSLVTDSNVIESILEQETSASQVAHEDAESLVEQYRLNSHVQARRRILWWLTRAERIAQQTGRV